MPSGIKICIIGPGAIGCLLGARLARGGYDVVLLDHRPSRATRRNANGITVRDTRETWRIQLQSTHSANHTTPPADLAFICVKSYDTAPAAGRLPDILKTDGIAVSLQNGIGNAEIIDLYAPGRTLCATSSVGAMLIDELTVAATGNGPTTVAGFGSTPPDGAAEVAAILTHAGFRAEVSGNLQSVLWSKLIINAAINPVTAIYRITNGELPCHPAAFQFASGIAREGFAVAAKLGIELSYKDPVEAFVAVCHATATNRSSMLRDCKTRRKTEIDAINGAIVAQARQHNIPTPFNIRACSEINSI